MKRQLVGLSVQGLAAIMQSIETALLMAIEGLGNPCIEFTALPGDFLRGSPHEPHAAHAYPGSHGSIYVNFVDFVREGLRDPLGFFVLSYLLGAAMCGAWTLATEPLRRLRRRVSART
jgi:hypothetical protein